VSVYYQGLKNSCFLDENTMPLKYDKGLSSRLEKLAKPIEIVTDFQLANFWMNPKGKVYFTKKNWIKEKIIPDNDKSKRIGSHL